MVVVVFGPSLIQANAQPQPLVAHRCCDPCRATHCCTHSFATNSRNFRDVAGMSCYISHAPPNKTLSHPSCHPSATVSRGHLLAKTDRATRGCSSYTHTNRATLCHVRAGCPFQNARFSRICRAWPKFLAGRPQGYPAKNFLFGLNFRSCATKLNPRFP